MPAMNDIPARAGNSPESRDIAYLIHPYTNLNDHEKTGPLVIDKGKGVYVYDNQGKEYIEGLAGLWCASLGFGEERLMAAATDAIQKLPFYHTFTHKSHGPAIELAEKLIEMAPVPMSKVFFANSGSEANDTAIKLVWYYHNAIGKPEKKKIIARQRGYHGVTVAAASLTGLPANHADFDLPIAGILHTDCPHHYRFAEDGESEEEFATRLAGNLEALILDEGPETIGAMFAEPIMGAGGVLLPPKTYFPKIQAVLKKYDVLFIADEVICGFYRTGNVWGSQTFGLKPDMMSMAKALSAAYLPISALMVSEPIYQAMLTESDKVGTFGHGYTYSGHPVCAAVAVEAQKIYDEIDIQSHVRRVAPKFQAAVKALADEDLVGEARGIGLIAGIELVRDKASKAPFDPLGSAGKVFAAAAQEHGLIVRCIMDSVALCPPLIINEAEIDDLFGRFRAALKVTQEWAAGEGHI